MAKHKGDCVVYFCFLEKHGKIKKKGWNEGTNSKLWRTTQKIFHKSYHPHKKHRQLCSMPWNEFSRMNFLQKEGQCYGPAWVLQQGSIHRTALMGNSSQWTCIQVHFGNSAAIQILQNAKKVRKFVQSADCPLFVWYCQQILFIPTYTLH